MEKGWRGNKVQEVAVMHRKRRRWGRRWQGTMRGKEAVQRRSGNEERRGWWGEED